MKNNSAKSTQKRSSKKFKTSVKDSGTNKLKTSVKNGTTKPKSQIPVSAKTRKSAIIPKPKILDKRKSLINKENNLLKSGKKSSTSLVKEENATNTNKRKSIKGRKSMKKSGQIDKNLNLKDSQNKNQSKDKDIMNSDVFNSENNTNALNSEDNSKLNEKNSKSNQENEKPNSISSKNENKELQSKSQSKKNSLKENNKTNELEGSKNRNNYLDYNQHFNINLVKDINEKPNYRYDARLENNIEPSESRLRNYKVESSDYITEKNKFLIKNLLFLLDKKPDDKKGTKNYFRQSLNAINNNEKNKILEMLDKTKKDIFRIKQDEKLNNINETYANKKMSEIYHTLFEQNYAQNRFENFGNNVQSPYYKEKYFFNYVDGVHPNMNMILRNNSANNQNIQRLINSEKKYNIMGKNNLKIENRDNRYLKYNYDLVTNRIDDKLNKDYREIYRKRRMQNMFDNINADIYAMNPNQDNFLRKTY
jgi:hypothetical protein